MTFASQLAAQFAPLAAAYNSADVTQGLSWAQSLVESYCNRTFDEVTDDVVFVDPYYGKALLPGTPVVSVSSVQGYLPSPTSGGMAWTALTNFKYASDTGLIYDTTGLPGTVWTSCTPSWPWLPGSLQVTYTHGYEVVPQPVVDVAVRLAQQYVTNPTQLVQFRTGSVEYRYSGAAGALVSEMDARVLDRYSVVSIA